MLSEFNKMGQILSLTLAGQPGDCEDCGSVEGTIKLFNMVDPYQVCLCANHWEYYRGANMDKLKTFFCKKNGYGFHSYRGNKNFNNLTSTVLDQ
jgi:hypothetical protein